MSNNEITSNLVIEAFSRLGLDPQRAVRAARGHTFRSWVASQAAQVGVVGAAALVIPGVHVPAMFVDVAVLLHKLAYCAWGIGQIHGCEVEGKKDFANILGIWTGQITDDALEASFVGGTLALTAGGVAAVGAPKAAAKLAGVGGAVLAKKVGAKSLAPVASLLSSQVATKVAAKLAAKITAKSVTSFFTGFAPVVGSLIGPVLSGGINMYFITRIAKSADEYYEKKRKFTIVKNS